MMDIVWKKALELDEAQQPFAVVTVVRSEKPTSAIPGAKALIYPTGKMIGFIGGQCTQSLVVSQALECMETGKSKLVLITSHSNQTDATKGLTVLPMNCQSEGTVELFIEPKLPKQTLLVIGDSPIAESITQIAKYIEDMNVKHFSIDNSDGNGMKDKLQQQLNPNSYVLVATMGHYDEQSITALQGIELAYLGLIASPKRTGKVIEYLKAEGASDEFCSFISAPAGLNLGAISPAEIAVTILAEIIQHKNSKATVNMKLKLSENKKLEVIDPVCNMVVDLNKTKFKAEYEGIEYGFCCPNCRRLFLKAPQSYLQKI